MSGSSRIAALGAVAVLASVYFISRASQSAGLSALAGDRSSISVLVQLGVNDSQPRSWQGSVTCENCDIARVSNWRPRAGDSMSGNSWNLKTRQGLNFQKRVWEAEAVFPPIPYMLNPGVVIDVRPRRGAVLRFQTANGSFSITPSTLTATRPATLLNGAVSAELVPAADLLSTNDYENDFASGVAMPNGDFWVAWLGYRKQQSTVFARRLSGGKWSNTESVSERPGDVAFTRMGRDRNNGVWVVWSEQTAGNFDLYGRRFDGKNWGRTERLTSAPQPDIYPALTTDSKGNLWLAWQGFRDGRSDIFARRYDGSSWSAEERISTSRANDWEPAIAADSKGRVYIAWDTYDKGNYDVLMRRYENGAWSQPIPVAASPRFEAHTTIACDKQDRLWAAWSYSGVEWGKDSGFLVKNGGTALYQWRAIGVAVYANGAWHEPVSDFNSAMPEDLQAYNNDPILEPDASGRMWLFFRHRFAKFRDVPSEAPAHRAAWEIYGVSYDGNRWSRPVAFPATSGRQDMRTAFVSSPGGDIHAVWPTDHRDFEEFLFRHADIYAARVPVPSAAPVGVQLKPHDQGDFTPAIIHNKEARDLEAVRGYSIRANGSQYKILRGDTHRHTEFSMDGNNDGSLQETYRYGLDAASLDFLAITDHNGDGGPDVEYINWLQQQTADLYMLPSTFTTMYSYERSLNYPNGHRNVIFAQRGNPTLPIPREEASGKTGAGALFQYLRRNRGISIPHTSATNMGTDWRDNDREVEPLVEIFQGDRVSAEYEGAPKAAYAGNLRSAPGGFRPAGYVWNAWAKGYKLGAEAASDHLSTHISFACILAPDSARQSILDSMRARHSYAATDNIVLDYRLKTDGKEYLQGDIVKDARAVSLNVHIIGTAAVRQIDVIRNNRFIYGSQPMRQDVSFTYEDGQPLAGDSYYYVRVIQVDDQMAWSSPVWITRR